MEQFGLGSEKGLALVEGFVLLSVEWVHALAQKLLPYFLVTVAISWYIFFPSLVEQLQNPSGWLYGLPSLLDFTVSHHSGLPY